jgi:hypothetical protein
MVQSRTKIDASLRGLSSSQATPSRDLGRFDDARNDLVTVLSGDELFPGTSADALVGLAELARLEGDADRARDYLHEAWTSVDVYETTLVEILIVHARLLGDEGDATGAEGFWQSVLTYPSATERQRTIAASRGSASPSIEL